MKINLEIIGYAYTGISDLSALPGQGTESGPVATVEIEPGYCEALEGLAPGREIDILTWLHRAGRDVLQTHPQGRREQPLKGVFALRSPHRPNPIGLHRARVLEFSPPGRFTVSPLEVLDKTPIVDIKPAIRDMNLDAPWGPFVPAELGEQIARVGRDAWLAGLVRGFNGNISIKTKTAVVVTAGGSCLGRLGPGDITAVDPDSGEPFGGARPTSELPMHLAVYRRNPKVHAIVHTHPPYLLAMSCIPGHRDPFPSSLYETGLFAEGMTKVPPLTPGSPELAEAVGKAAKDRPAVFMGRHGLVCAGTDPDLALTLSEELESLARIKWLTLKGERRK